VALMRACSKTDVPEGEARRFEIRGRLIAIVHLVDDDFRAIDAICSHAHYFLDEGDADVEDETIECPKHGSTFDLETGRPRSLPATTPIAVYPVKLEHDDVMIEVD
jgi:3-phenylpropionate/trans-cinnamate dioxygenase ferredoxin subunit